MCHYKQIKKLSDMAKKKTCWAINYGHDVAKFPIRFYVYATDEDKAKESIKKHWHGHDYACDSKITSVVEMQKDPWE